MCWGCGISKCEEVLLRSLIDWGDSSVKGNGSHFSSVIGKIWRCCSAEGKGLLDRETFVYKRKSYWGAKNVKRRQEWEGSRGAGSLALELDILRFEFCLYLSSCASLSKLLNLCGPWFSQLQNGDNNAYCTELFSGINKVMFVECLAECLALSNTQWMLLQ